MTEDMAKLRRSVRVNRILILVILLLFVIIIAGMGIVGLYAYRFSQQMIPISRKFMEIDWTWISDQISRAELADMSDKIKAMEANIASLKESIDAIAASLPR
ncbi:MAG: hypothetical protein J5487_00195 [Lachnospiraceae bacterium]|nr:hypothetical protein [Lachnospiraceae bacterium]